jgi:hypothetical protein
MSMHLVGPYLTTTNYKKRKQKKLSQAQTDRLQVEWRQHNKRMRKLNCHSAQFDTFEQYLSYIRGEKPSNIKSTTTEVYDPNKNAPYRRETPDIPSCSDSVAGYAPKKEPTKYTGDYITGIATMHKSNIIPITNKKQAVEVSQMRRN